MLTVSLHGIRLHSPLGLYEQEHVLGNDFEVDVDVRMAASLSEPWPFVDYSLISALAGDVFGQPGLLIETFVRELHERLKARFPDAVHIRVAARKYHPPMPGEIRYAQVCFEG